MMLKFFVAISILAAAAKSADFTNKSKKRRKNAISRSSMPWSPNLIASNSKMGPEYIKVMDGLGKSIQTLPRVRSPPPLCLSPKADRMIPLAIPLALRLGP